jgi:hypothetical protein
MQPDDYGLTSIKDPRVYFIAGLYMAFVCVPARQRWTEDKAVVWSPAGFDATGLMTSADGIYWRTFKYVFEPGQGLPGEWGHFRARINSIIYLPPVFLGFFDGGTTSYDNYEEWCGIAFSHDLEQWTRVSIAEPWVKSANGCVRYVDALTIGKNVWYYCEWARADGSHELRVSKAPQ